MFHFYSYEGCDFSGAIVDVDIEDTYFRVREDLHSLYVPLREPGTYYFACGIGGHCYANQKIIVNVRDDEEPELEPESEIN